MTFSVQSQLLPSHQLLLEHPGEGVFQGEGEELSSPCKEESRVCRAQERQAKSSQLSSAFPAECLTAGKNGKKSNPRRWKSWCRAQHTNPQRRDRKRCAPLQQACTEAAAARGFPKPAPKSPQQQQNQSPGLTLTLAIMLLVNQKTTESLGIGCSLTCLLLQGLSA